VSRVAQFQGDPKDPNAVITQVEEIRRTLDYLVEFGNPQDPTDATSTTLAGAAAGNHPGTLQNIFGSWVEVEVSTADTAVTCYHNLNMPVITGEPNVRWLVFGLEHDGWDGGIVGAASWDGAMSCSFQTGDTINVNDIQLRFYAVAPRVIAAAHPLKATLFFIPAIR
jgi:hypothetical protein